ncbi:MAG: hypothetical protein LBJ35_06205 [Spirochaetaceae bacterium]|jgi:hypothetical protein|nr:hypothetical protein [Spirochaetaceae bacterium]
MATENAKKRRKKLKLLFLSMLTFIIELGGGGDLQLQAYSVFIISLKPNRVYTRFFIRRAGLRGV